MKRILITGASRGIGAATALECARRWAGSEIVLMARRITHPHGCLVDVASQVTRLGASPIIVGVDVRDSQKFRGKIRDVLHSMGGLDVLVNNASALATDPLPSDKSMDLVYEVNLRATMVAIQECTPSLDESKGAIVTLSPPVRTGRLEWIRDHPAYTISKYGMTLATLAAASERVRANCLWPKHTVKTDATRLIERNGVLQGAFTRGREPETTANAICELIESSYNAKTLLDEDLVKMPRCSGPLDVFVHENMSCYPSM